MTSTIAAWPLTSLAQVLVPVSRPVPVEPLKTYLLLGMHWYAQGLYIKDQKQGAQIQATTLYQVKEEDFVYNRLFAWKGSFGIADADTADCYVSNEFPCFRVDETRAFPAFLLNYFSQIRIWQDAQESSSGTTPTSRLRLKEEQLLAMEIPLPSLDEQRRIVARIDALAAKIEEARGLRREAGEEAEGLLNSSMRELFSASEQGHWQSLSIEAACEALIDYRGRTPPISDSGIPHLTSSNIKNGQIDWNTNKFVTPEIYDAFMTRGIPQPGDVIFTMEAPLGEAAVILDHRRFSLAQRTLLLRGKQGIIEGPFLARVLTSPDVRTMIYARATGTTVKGIASRELKHIILPIPPLDEQQRIVAYLDDLQSRADALKRLQAEAAAELEALLPAVLDQAFRGEL